MEKSTPVHEARLHRDKEKGTPRHTARLHRDKEKVTPQLGFTETRRRSHHS